MKIAYNHQIFSLQAYGGISRYFIELSSRINQLKHDEAIIKVFAPIHKNQYLDLNSKKLLFNGFKIPDLKGTSKLNTFLNSFLSPILLNTFKPDLIHETYYDAKKISYKNKVKKIITVYDMIHELFPREFSKKDKTAEIKKLAVMQADHIICISKNTQKDLVKVLDVDIKKTSVVHLGFSLMEDGKSNLKINKKPYLLYVGSRRGYKNFFRFLEAYAKSSNLKNFFNLVVFGGGPFTSQEINFIELMKIDRKKIRNINGNDSDLAICYKNASLFIYPSLYEGFGIPPLEAMSFGCPVVCSNTSSIPEIVGDAAIYFNPYSVDSICESIEKILNNEKLRLSIIDRGFQRLKKFSWDKCAIETFEIYKKILL